jgi:NAD(P)-dependent dehydrogenase (short-subunit alcohol dehydrogenase family)
MKTILITGATSGIGLAAAQHIRQQGHRVLITGRKPERLEVALTALNGTDQDHKQQDTPAARGYCCDQTDVTAITQLSELLLAERYQLDALILNAGIFLPQAFESFTTTNLQQQLNSNLLGPLQTLYELLPVLNNPASVVLVSSIVADKAFANCTAYAASKAALEGAMGPLNLELASRGIRVNCLRPGITLTEIQSKAGMNEEALAQLTENMKSTLAGRILQPDDMVAALEYLALGGSSAVRGLKLQVDGGYCL